MRTGFSGDSPSPPQEPLLLVPEDAREKAKDLLGPYELLELAGEGAMGRVWRARHTKLGREVAVKVLRPEYAKSGSVAERFLREAQTVTRIRHPNVVEVFDFGEQLTSKGLKRIYFVMEWLEGESLERRMERGPSSLADVAAIGRQLCSALEAAHALGVVHRDVKPANVLLTGSGGMHVKVLDFGIAKLAPLEGVAGGQTQHGLVIGTPDYMSPEQARGQSVDPRADVYSVGLVLYRLLVGRHPFDTNNVADLMMHILSTPAPPVPRTSASAESVPKALAALVHRCLEKEPDRRPKSMAHLAAKLVDSVTPRRRRLTLPLALAAGLAILGLGTGAVAARMLRKQSPTPAPVAEAAFIAVPRPVPAAPPEVSEVAEEPSTPAPEARKLRPRPTKPPKAKPDRRRRSIDDVADPYQD